ncbi:MAG: DUF4423 domain-containing protein [Bacteriovoracaceae bacterium]
MEIAQRYYSNKLKEVLSLRQQTNPSYSIRAFARDLDISSSSLSQILAGKRALPAKKSSDIIKKLKLPPQEESLFKESLGRHKASIDEIEISPMDGRFMLDESYFKVIAEWEHYAVLSLYEIPKFKPEIKEIAQRLGISETRTEIVLFNLEVCGLLVRNKKGKLVKAHPDVKTTEDIANSALVASHLETLEMGKKKILEVALDLRDFSSSTLSLDLKKIPEAKTIIREFRQKMSALVKNGNKTDIYQLAVQFYPLTQINNQGISK